MNRFLPLISCAFVGILVSSCARNPPSVVPEPTYGSASGTFHRSAKHHHVALAQVPLRHPRAASEGHRRLLSPWNYPAPANAATPHTDHLQTDPNASPPPIGIPICNFDRLLSQRTRAAGSGGAASKIIKFAPRFLGRCSKMAWIATTG
jgi:hypothetical protein